MNSLKRYTECSQMWIRTVGGIIYILQLYICCIFWFTDSVRGTKNEQSHMNTYGGRSHVYIFIYIYRHVYLTYISFCDCRHQASFSVKRGCVCRENSHIYYAVMYLAYILIHWQPWPLSTITGVIKRTYFFCFIRPESR